MILWLSITLLPFSVLVFILNCYQLHVESKDVGQIPYVFHRGLCVMAVLFTAARVLEIVINGLSDWHTFSFRVLRILIDACFDLYGLLSYFLLYVTCYASLTAMISAVHLVCTDRAMFVKRRGKLLYSLCAILNSIALFTTWVLRVLFDDICLTIIYMASLILTLCCIAISLWHSYYTIMATLLQYPVQSAQHDTSAELGSFKKYMYAGTVLVLACIAAQVRQSVWYAQNWGQKGYFEREGGLDYVSIVVMAFMLLSTWFVWRARRDHTDYDSSKA
eukprot:TRINITY_DN14394_c0_g1_i1.p1 TRINITY_DN14394_c0_g1~~TRINITY_DN14394_c0_g1_i1.p1  ORF type:complete len:276 (-),score=33.28 TRINITY_DN14394_c0_g1_i1:87-914(-)